MNATSEIEGQVAIYMSTSIGTDGNTNANINKSIANQELYNSTTYTQKCNEIKIEVDSNVLANTIIDTIKNGRVNK